jgi:hypothetical protein
MCAGALTASSSRHSTAAWIDQLLEDPQEAGIATTANGRENLLLGAIPSAESRSCWHIASLPSWRLETGGGGKGPEFKSRRCDQRDRCAYVASGVQLTSFARLTWYTSAPPNWSHSNGNRTQLI